MLRTFTIRSGASHSCRSSPNGLLEALLMITLLREWDDPDEPPIVTRLRASPCQEQGPEQPVKTRQTTNRTAMFVR